MKEGSTNKLTEDQKSAIEHERGPLLIVAGPGSGKTEVMTRRVAHLVNEKGIGPDRILVVTFTNRAADELKDRIQERVNVNVEDMQVSTIHSFCDRILTDNIAKTSLRRGFRILDRNQQFLFVYANRKKLGLDKVKKGRAGEFVREVISTYNKCTENLVDGERFVSEVKKQLGSEQDERGLDFLTEWLAVAESYNVYCEVLRQRNFVDFSFLLRHAYDLLETDKKVLQAVQGQYEHILIDEYQDTNRLQDLLLQMVAKTEDNICVVGDDDQSIYRFRGATVQNFFSFNKKYKRVREVELARNFRSTKKIVDASTALIEHNPDTDRIPKELFTENKEGDDILLVHRDSAQDEAEAVVDAIGLLKENEAIRDYSEVALLFRSVRSHAGPYLEVFRERKIPYIVIGDGKFLERSDVRDLLHLFSFLANTKKWADKFLSCRILGLSKPTLKAISKYSGDLHTLKTERELADIGVRDREDLKRLSGILNTKRKVLKRKQDDILTVFFELLEATSCFQRYTAPDREDDFLNLALFTSIINDFDDHAGSNNIFYFLRYINDLGYGAVDELRAEIEGAARIMTVHQAKGLEFPVVVLGAAMEGRFPLRFRAEQYPVPESCLEKMDRLTEDVHTIDERKLFYVGMTRAKRLLIIATADKVTKRGNGPSKFIGEIRSDRKACVSTDLCPILCKPEKPKKKREYTERSRLSYSKIEYYLSCPLRYKYLAEYDFKVPQATYYSFGSTLHNTLEDLHNLALARRGRKMDEDLVRKLYLENWIPFGYRGRKTEDDYKAAGLKYVINYFREHRTEFNQIEKVEELYAFLFKDFVISGKVDLLRQKEKERLEIVDFKTHRVTWMEDYDPRLQLSMYALACEKEEKRPVRSLCVHYLKEDECDYLPWNTNQSRTTEQRLAGILKDIGERRYPPKVGKRCRSCEFKRICPPFLDSGREATATLPEIHEMEEAL